MSEPCQNGCNGCDECTDYEKDFPFAQPVCLTCNGHGAVGNILTAEPCPDCSHWEGHAMTWQPIETAPHGKKLIVTYLNQLNRRWTVMARYFPPETLDWHDDYGWEEDAAAYAPEGWYEETETHEVVMPLPEAPTHWMPLPPPPPPPPEA